MAEQTLKAHQVTGVGSASFEQFAATPGAVTSFTITTSVTAREGWIAFSNTTDDLWLGCAFSFGNLATGTARTTFSYLMNVGGGSGRIVKIARDSTGTGLTVSWSDESDRNLLATVTGLVSLGSLSSFSGYKYTATVRTA